jgi:hypothetical protein
MSEAVYWEFMIRCEEYKEWCHGRCVKVTPEEPEAMEETSQSCHNFNISWIAVIITRFNFILYR